MSAYLNQGLTARRDVTKNAVSHVGVTTDATAFDPTHEHLDPADVGGADNLIKAATKTDVDAFTFDATIEIDGDTEFTGKQIWTIGILDGDTRADALTRSVRTVSIGIQAGDLLTIGVRHTDEDNTA